MQRQNGRGGGSRQILMSAVVCARVVSLLRADHACDRFDMQVMCELKQLAAAGHSGQHGRPDHLQQVLGSST